MQLDAGSPAARPHNQYPRMRFISVYRDLAEVVDEALQGSEPRWGMEILAREEANYQNAVRWAMTDRHFEIAARLGDVFREYLERSGRLRERDTWVAWLANECGSGGFTAQAAVYDTHLAWSLYTKGQPEEAIRKLKALIQRLRKTTDFDPVPNLAFTEQMLGRVLDNCGLSEQAILVLQEAIRHCEVLVEKAGGIAFTRILSDGVDMAASQSAAGELSTLATTLGDLANAMHDTGRLDEALDAAEKALRIRESLGDHRNLASGYGRYATILMAQGRFAEAECRLAAALAAARRSGDKVIEAITLHHQGDLASQKGEFDQASHLYQAALKMSQDANNDGNAMLACIALGSLEMHLRRLPEARGWYERSREIAQHLGDTAGLSKAAHNLGIISAKEGEAALVNGDKKSARQHFEKAKDWLFESLRTEKNEPNVAKSQATLAEVCLSLNDLSQAERYAHEARQVLEKLGLKEVMVVYHIISEIALARGEPGEAAEWDRKHNELLDELVRRAQSSGAALPDERMIQQLSFACAQAGFGQTPPQKLETSAESALKGIEQMPAPWPDLAAFLRRLAAGKLPLIPSTLLPELQQFLQQLVEAVEKHKR